MWSEKIAIGVRSRHPEVFCKKGVLKNFAKFTGKYLFQSPFFNKAAGLFVKKETLAYVFLVNFMKFLRTPLLQNTSKRLLLNFIFTEKVYFMDTKKGFSVYNFTL